MNYKKLLEIKKLNFNNKKSLDSKKILSPIFFFTDRKKNIDLNQVIKNLPKNTNIILREYALNENARLLILQKIHDLFYQKKLSLIIGKSFNSQMLRYINGVHYSDLDFNKNLFIKRNFCKNSNLIFTISMHKLINLHKISLLKPDVIFLHLFGKINKFESFCAAILENCSWKLWPRNFFQILPIYHH